MKKGIGKVFIFGIFLVLILTSFVSAGLIGDLWKKITGQAVEGSLAYQTQWFDVDNPSGYGDYELLKNDYISANACENPLGIYCETTGGINYKETGEVVHCELDRGLWCVNSEQPDGRCNYDYRVRFDCPDEEEQEQECNVNSDCGEDYFIEGTKVCDDSNNVAQYKKVFSCLQGICDEEKVLEKIEDCNEDCLNGECVSAEYTECIDNDGGKNSFENGTVFYQNRSFEDVCEGPDFVQEWYCYNGKPNDISIECDEGCENGACVEEEIVCEDSDGGKSSFEKGTVFYQNQTFEDVCEGPDFVQEWYCYNGKPHDVSIKCDEGCENGACLNYSNETEEETNETEYYGNYSYCQGDVCHLFMGDKITHGNYVFEIGTMGPNFVNLTLENLNADEGPYHTGYMNLRGPKGLDKKRYIVLFDHWYYEEPNEELNEISFIKFEFFVKDLVQGESYCENNYCKLYESDRAFFEAEDFTFDMGINYKDGVYSIYPSKISSGEIVEEEAIMSFYSDDWYVEPVTFTTTYLHGGGTHNLTSFFFDEVNYFVFSVDEVHATHDIYGNAIAQGESYISFDYSYDIGSKKSVIVSEETSNELKSSVRSLNYKSDLDEKFIYEEPTVLDKIGEGIKGFFDKGGVQESVTSSSKKGKSSYTVYVPPVSVH